jgi:hypothetical protein
MRRPAASLAQSRNRFMGEFMTDGASAKPQAEVSDTDQNRRMALKRLGRFGLVSAPAVTLLLAAASKPAAAQTCSLCPSSRSFKAPDGSVDAAALLAAVQSLPVETWRYKTETGLETRPHIGPYAEDFHAAFGVGDGVTINPIDAMGVCLAAIQALTQKVEMLEAELEKAKSKTA